MHILRKKVQREKKKKGYKKERGDQGDMKEAMGKDIRKA